jgi:hypothetical protein
LWRTAPDETNAQGFSPGQEWLLQRVLHLRQELLQAPQLRGETLSLDGATVLRRVAALEMDGGGIRRSEVSPSSLFWLVRRFETDRVRPGRTRLALPD